MPDTGTPRTVRARTRMALVGVLAVLLAGCIRFDGDLSVSSDDTIDGTVVLAVDRGLLDMAGDPPDRGALDALLRAGAAAFPDDLRGVRVEPYDQDGFVGRLYRFDAVPLDDFNAGRSAGPDPGEPLRIERDGDMFRLSADVDLGSANGDLGSANGDLGSANGDLGSANGAADAGDPGGDPSVVLSDAEVQVRVTFPGEVLEANGEVAGTTVTWNLDLTRTNQLSALARADAGPTLDDLLLYGLLAVIALAVVAIVVLLVVSDDGPDSQRQAEPIGAPLSGAERAARDRAAAGEASPTPGPGDPPGPAATPPPPPTSPPGRR